MKFNLNYVILWLKNGYQRKLKFEKNKVNVITGKQSTGKSTIIEIIDYCFFSSEKNMPEGEIIDDSVEWYGINFNINDKHMTIARHQDINKNQYFYDSNGNIPNKPFDNFNEKNLKLIIDKEFFIDGNVVFPYGGTKITKESKISPRYFLLFNTQRKDTLSHKDTLFDKQSGTGNIRYIEALERMFDIVLGVSSIENLLKIEKLKENEKELSKLKNKQESYEKKESVFNDELLSLCEIAKELKLVDSKLDIEKCLIELKKQIESVEANFNDNDSLLEKYEKEKLNLRLKISKFKKYQNKYKTYKSLLKKDIDSLQPIEYLNEKFAEIYDNEDIDQLLKNLNSELSIIKEFVSKSTNPTSKELKGIIQNYEGELKDLDEKIKKVSKVDLDKNITVKKQLLFLGELKAKFELYDSKKEKKDYTNQIKELEKNIKELEKNINVIDRSVAVNILNDLMYEVFEKENYKLGGYEDYRPFFSIKKKLVLLKKIDKFIKQSSIDERFFVEKIGSSSNHLFLHLAFFTAIHRLFIKQNIPFIPQFFILDQPDSPYYSTDDSEKEIFFKALRILDNQIQYFNEQKEDFQIILLEHIEWKDCENADFKHYHLVEQWRNEGEGLIPLEWQI